MPLAVDFGVSVLVILLVGFVGFFVMATVLLVRLVGYVFRTLFGRTSPQSEPAAPRAAGRVRVCPQARCAHVNPPAARYCARCGRPLHAVCDVDAYG